MIRLLYQPRQIELVIGTVTVYKDKPTVYGNNVHTLGQYEDLASVNFAVTSDMLNIIEVNPTDNRVTLINE